MTIGGRDISFTTEPAVWMGLIEAAIVLAVAFGVPLTLEQKSAIIGFVSAFLAIAGSVVVRANVTPVATLAPAPKASES